MFNLDINFLNDRPGLKSGSAAPLRGGAVRRSQSDNESQFPLYVGVLVALTSLGLTGAAFAYFSWQKGSLETQQIELDTKLGAIDSKRKELADANKKVEAADGEVKALATVFDQIKSWAAISQDFKDRLPSGVQLASIVQVPPVAAASPGSSSIYSSEVTVKGEANDFDQINDFLVNLKKSSFLKPEDTRIIETTRTESKSLPALSLPKALELPVKPGQEKKETNNQAVKFPGKITFTIQSKLSETPTSEMLRELDRKGAVGLYGRIEALKSRRVKP